MDSVEEAEGPESRVGAPAGDTVASSVQVPAAAEAKNDTPDMSVGDEVVQSPARPADSSAQIVGEGTAVAGEVVDPSAAVEPPLSSPPHQTCSDAAAPAAAAGVSKAPDGGACAVPAAGSAEEALHARVETPVEGDEHASGSSAGSAARSPHSSGNVMSSEWSIVSGTQLGTAGGAAVPAHANGAPLPGVPAVSDPHAEPVEDLAHVRCSRGVWCKQIVCPCCCGIGHTGIHKEHVPAVEEGEEGGEEIEVQEEDVNFDDLDSLGGEVVDNGDDDDEEIDENWGQWE